MDVQRVGLDAMTASVQALLQLFTMHRTPACQQQSER